MGYGQKLPFWYDEFYLPDKDIMVPYFSTNFIFNPYKTKFCGMKKLYTRTRKVMRWDQKVGIQIFAYFFLRVLVDFRKIKSPIYQLFK